MISVIMPIDMATELVISEQNFTHVSSCKMNKTRLKIEICGPPNLSGRTVTN